MNKRTYKFAPPSEEKPDVELVLKYVFKGDIETLRDYLTIFPEVVDMKEQSNGNVGIHIASSKGNIPIISLFLSKGANINLKDMFGNTALHYAVDKSRKDTVIWLVTNGANINSQDYRGNSPIHVACINNDVEMVRILLNRNADPSITDLANIKPIDKTTLQSIKKIIELKIEALHSKNDIESSTQSVNWMTFGVGLGVGMGMALAKRQQAMIEQYVEQQQRVKDLEDPRRRRRSMLSKNESSTFSPQQHLSPLGVQQNSSLVAYHPSSAQYSDNRKFL